MCGGVLLQTNGCEVWSGVSKDTTLLCLFKSKVVFSEFPSLLHNPAKNPPPPQHIFLTHTPTPPRISPPPETRTPHSHPSHRSKPTIRSRGTPRNCRNHRASRENCIEEPIPMFKCAVSAAGGYRLFARRELWIHAQAWGGFPGGLMGRFRGWAIAEEKFTARERVLVTA